VDDKTDVISIPARMWFIGNSAIHAGIVDRLAAGTFFLPYVMNVITISRSAQKITETAELIRSLCRVNWS